MTKYYVVAVLEVEKTKDNMTLCKTGCTNGFGMPVLEAIATSRIITTLVLLPGASIDVEAIINDLKGVINRG